EPLALRWRCARHQRRAEEKEPVLVDSSGSVGPVILLFENGPVEDAEAASAVLHGPGDDAPSGVEEHPLPLAVRFESVRSVHRRKRRIGDALIEPLARVRTEFVLLGREAELQQNHCRTPAPASRKRVSYIRLTVHV